MVVSARCPLCNEKHSFSVTVTRDIAGPPTIPPPSDQETILRQFPLVFTCPVKSRMFEADVFLEEHPQVAIRGVQSGSAIEGFSQGEAEG